MQKKLCSFALFKNLYMNLKSIISITGKPGLYKIVSQTKSGFIVESLAEGKKLPVYSTDKVSALEDICIYTTTEDMPIIEVYAKVYDTTKGAAAIDHNAKPEELRAYLANIVPEFDQERVYNSDLKKLFLWFNILVKSEFFKQQEAEAKKAGKKDDKKEDTKKVVDKKVTTKKVATAKPIAKKPSAAKTPIKKAAGSKKNG